MTPATCEIECAEIREWRAILAIALENARPQEIRNEQIRRVIARVDKVLDRSGGYADPRIKAEREFRTDASDGGSAS